MRRGFTLVEVLVAMLITSFLVLGINGVYRQAHLLWSAVEDARPLYASSRHVLDCLRAELSGVYVPAGDPEASAFTLVTDGDGAMELTFYTLAPAWRISLEYARGARIRYRFTKGQTPAENTLERFEQLCAGEQVIAPEVRDVVLAGRFECGVHVMEREASPSGASWQTSYESKDQAPRAIRFLLQWQTEKEEPAAAFDIVVPVLCDQQVQEAESPGDPNDSAAADRIPVHRRVAAGAVRESGAQRSARP